MGGSGLDSARRGHARDSLWLQQEMDDGERANQSCWRKGHVEAHEDETMEAFFSFLLTRAPFSFDHFHYPPPMCAPYAETLPTLYALPLYPPVPPPKSATVGEQEEETSARSRDMHSRPVPTSLCAARTRAPLSRSASQRPL